jgi:hypothetical protein
MDIYFCILYSQVQVLDSSQRNNGSGSWSHDTDANAYRQDWQGHFHFLFVFSLYYTFIKFTPLIFPMDQILILYDVCVSEIRTGVSPPVRYNMVVSLWQCVL